MPTLEQAEARRRFAAARVAVLASRRPGGGMHQVPVTFVVVGDEVLLVTDGKPKRGGRLQRHANLAADPRGGLLVQHWDEDWSRLWWVRADGRALVSDDEADLAHAGALLREKYPQYAEVPISTPVILLRVERWSGWQAQAG